MSRAREKDKSMNINGGVEILTLGITLGFLICFILSFTAYAIYEILQIMKGS